MKLNFKLDINKLLIIGGAISLIFIIAFFVWWQKDIIINNDDVSQDENLNFKKSSISGIACEQAERRPVAVMLASDLIVRPLSGISEADMVFEMPVTPDGTTRMMAIYQCEEPKEIGSIRSAREDFIPLVAGVGAVYAHWGGEKGALKKLDKHIVDNVDAMVYENVYFYRKNGVPQPHNGFANFEKLLKATDDLDYDMKNTFPGYMHGEKDKPKNIVNLTEVISINYPHPFNVQWIYNKESNNYRRLRNGSSEIDKNNNSQVSAEVVVIMETTSQPISKDYISINTTGSGNATIYQNGTKISGKWSKDPSHLDSKLFFYDNDGKEIELTPGKIWVEITIK